MAVSSLNPLARQAPLATTPAGQFPGSAAAADPLSTLGYRLTLLYVVLLVGRVPEICAILLGSSAYQVMIVSGLLFGVAVISGVLPKLGATRIGLFWIAFHLWVVVTLPISGYRRGSLEALGEVSRYVPALFFVGGFFDRSVDTLRRGVWALAWAGAIGVVWSFLTGAGVDDRTERFAAVGSFSNANELAIYALLVMPAWAFIVSSSRYNWFIRLFFVSIIGLGLITVAKTGSRSGVMTIALIAIVMFFSVNVINKLKLFVVFGAFAIIALTLTPAAIKERWSTILNDKSKAGEVAESAAGSAIGSSEARYALLVESIETTIRHPIFGTGFGVYSDIAASERHEEGKSAHWQVTHNAYTQVSAETGIPGFLLYYYAFWLSIKAAWKARKLGRSNPQYTELGNIATAILYCYLVFAFNGLFTSMATEFTLYTLAGFSIALHLLTTRLLQQQATAPAMAPTPSPKPRPGLKGVKPALPEPAPARTAPPAKSNSDAPWRRNPRKYPPRLGDASR